MTEQSEIQNENRKIPPDVLARADRVINEKMEQGMTESQTSHKSNIPAKTMLWLICAMLFALCPSAYAQQSDKIPRIGFLQRRVPPTAENPDPLGDAFRQGLRDLGYIDGKNIRIEHRYAHGRSDLLPSLVAEFVQLKVDVIVVASIQAIRAATQATKTSYRDRDANRSGHRRVRPEFGPPWRQHHWAYAAH